LSGIAALIVLASTAAPTRADDPPALAPLTDAKWLESLPMPAGHAVFVSVPLGATEPRPVMVGMHGAGDRPEWACGGYRGATRAYPFILCPRGLPQGPDKFAAPSAERIEKDVTDAVAALRARFGAYVADGPLLYAGFSLGAIHGVKVLTEQASTFPVALLIEGGYTELTPAAARTYRAHGGKRVLLACGQAECTRRFRTADSALSSAGVEVELLDAHTGRHNLDGAMVEALKQAWPWLVAGDPRWEGLGR
jgi:predicted esterase